ncbi:AGAP003496-PA [Anopheles gambiae str. PEST]|uniref:AGAP003496-PA n=1 Tax=Anopheles gambiae TaxID=7165 RepID=Q7QH35_ANOGA|nr:AGAP003496-PA [Anopheles gambiae str. PEST]
MKLHLCKAASSAGEGVANPIYSLLVPSQQQDTATLTYNYGGKVTIVPLIQSRGRPAAGTDCQYYREATRAHTRHNDDRTSTELVSCDGRIRGTVRLPEGTFRIEYNATAGVHFLTRLKDPQRRPLVGRQRTKRNHLSTIKGPYQANAHSSYVELLLVADNSLFRKLDQDMWQVYHYCASLVNHINMLYNPLNIYIALTDVVVWKDTDRINVSTRAEETLNSFLAYRSSVLLHDHPHDHAQLLTTIEFKDNVIGKAKVGGMCSDRSSGAIVRVHTDDVGVQASTLAHEMGHSFTMEHDEDGDCACPDRKCIMTRTVTGLTLQHWSNCSLQQLSTALGRGLHHCLSNRPSQLAFESCGNGFVESGEECDCGLEEACENRLKDPQRRPLVGRQRTKRNHLSTIKGPYQANAHSSYVELLLVADNSLFRKLDQDMWQVYHYCASLVNHINMLYNPLNIYIALTDVVVWRDTDRINVSTRAEETLNSFLAYRSSVLLHDHPHDHAQLLTTIEFKDNVIGKAKVGGMCSDRSSGAIVRVHTDDVGVQASTLAHEMGHSFTMEHDEDGDCACPDRKCIMTRTVTGLTLQHWSNCSLQQLSTALGRGLHHCLSNRPSQLAFESCGNGFVESGEECDCGLEEACENRCCDARTCRLREGAQCATGECCDLETCQLREPAVPCRGQRSECDLPEYCTGRSEYCPPDVHRRDTEPCAGGEAHCMAGRCRTRTDQCRALWGPSGHAASEACYEANAKGIKYGNCGYEGRPAESFRKCAPADVQCGLLFCHHHKADEELELGEYNGDSRYSVQKGNETMRHVLCRSAYVDLGEGQGRHPAFVPDGSPCGEGRMCYRQRCESVERLNAWGIGGKVCAHGCFGRGVCNSEGHCHCQQGYDPPYCEHQGVGGSLDSGPASTETGLWRDLLTFAVLTLLGCTVLLLLVAVCIRSFRNGGFAPSHWGRGHWGRPCRVRGTSMREPIKTATPIASRDISLPKYHSSTRDISDDQQYRPIGGGSSSWEQLGTGSGVRVLAVPRSQQDGREPPLTIEYRIVPAIQRHAPLPPVPVHRQRPF